MKVGLFFGTFDPVHNGHIAIAEHVISTNLIDQIWFIVTPQSPFKQKGIIASKEHRLKMVKIAIQRCSNFVASSIEFELPPPQYTFKTLNFLESKFKAEHEFSIILGLDNYASLLKKEWYNSEHILKKYQMFIYQRNAVSNLKQHANLLGYSLKNRHVRLKGCSIEISSTRIRELLSNEHNKYKFSTHQRLSNQQLDSFLPKKILEYIEKNKLYNASN